MGFSLINHLAIGVPPCTESPISPIILSYLIITSRIFLDFPLIIDSYWFYIPISFLVNCRNCRLPTRRLYHRASSRFSEGFIPRDRGGASAWSSLLHRPGSVGPPRSTPGEWREVAEWRHRARDASRFPKNGGAPSHDANYIYIY